MLDEKAILAHCVHLDNAEMDIIKATNSIIAHNPLSNLKLGSGIAPTLDFLEKEINVTLGTDGAISGNDLDMWLTMRLAATLPKGKLMKPDIVNAKDVFQMGGKLEIFHRHSRIFFQHIIHVHKCLRTTKDIGT